MVRPTPSGRRSVASLTATTRHGLPRWIACRRCFVQSPEWFVPRVPRASPWRIRRTPSNAMRTRRPPTVSVTSWIGVCALRATECLRLPMVWWTAECSKLAEARHAATSSLIGALHAFAACDETAAMEASPPGDANHTLESARAEECQASSARISIPGNAPNLRIDPPTQPSKTSSTSDKPRSMMSNDSANCGSLIVNGGLHITVPHCSTVKRPSSR